MYFYKDILYIKREFNNIKSLFLYKYNYDHFNMSAQAPEFIHGDSAPFYFDKERKSPKGTIIV